MDLDAQSWTSSPASSNVCAYLQTVVFGFTGATTSCFVVFILPAFFFIRLLKLNPKHRANTSKTDFLMAWFQLVLGVVLVPVCLVVVSMKV